jgi:hypothetical protein
MRATQYGSPHVLGEITGPSFQAFAAAVAAACVVCAGE